MEDSLLNRHKSMEEAFLLGLPKHNNNRSEADLEACSYQTSITKWSVLYQEVTRLGYIAGPLVAVMLSQYLLQVISMMMVGHLGELSLSSFATAISLSEVTGFSLLVGMASALETICGQAYGAEQYQKVGLQTYTAIFSLFLVCLPISLIWIYMGKLLVLIGQDPLISHEAGKFTTWLVPALFAYATLQPLLFQGIEEFFRFAIPSAVMACLEWWSFELLILMSGILPNPALETSVLSVCLSTVSTFYAIPYGLGAAVSTRVSNELGAGNAQAASIATFASMILAIIETSTVTTALLASRRVFGYSFSNEKEVVDYVTEMAPLVCVTVILDSIQGVFSGVARGCGWQHIGAIINPGAFYLCDIPIAAILGFWVKLRGKGLWICIQSGSFVQTVLLSIVTSCTNWEKQASKARERIFENGSLRNELED